MNILDYFYSNPPSIEKFYPRKFFFPDKCSFELIGARGVGKSALVINYLKSLKKGSFIYIDCQDPLFILEYIDIRDLNSFIKEENIKLLILDHYYEGFLEFLPDIERVIIVSNKKSEFNLPQFKLMPLDFEEFLGFSRGYDSLSAFNLYTKQGSLPALATTKDFHQKAKELFFEKFETQEGKVLLILAIFHCKITTPNQIYLKAKEYFKISKDWLYKTIKEFEKEGIIYQIETVEKSFGKKLVLYDFAFAKYLNKHLTIFSIIDSLIALALIKHNIKFKALTTMLAYLKSNFELILVAPFGSKDELYKKHSHDIKNFKKLKIKKVAIVTISNSFEYKIKDITFRAIPFYEWNILLDEE